MDGASALIDAVRQDCPRSALRPIDSLANATERGAELVVASAALVCSDAMSCVCALACRLAVEDILDRLWRETC